MSYASLLNVNKFNYGIFEYGQLTGVSCSLSNPGSTTDAAAL
jgi:hypothetical protein